MLSNCGALKSPLDCKEITPVSLKGNQPWILIGRIYAEALILWPSDVKSRLIRKDPDAGQDWGQEERGTTEDEMVGWHHWLTGHEFEQILGDSEGQGSLACCNTWSHKESDTTEWLNNNKSNYYLVHLCGGYGAELCGLWNLCFLTRDWILSLSSESSES